MEHVHKTSTPNEQRVAEEYLSSLADLNCNSKPLINMLTMLAEENIDYAPVIVKVVEQHIAQVPADFKLPILYLIDSIVKNVKGTYLQLFSQCIVHIFCGVFEMVHEKVRERMYALRQTWNDVFLPQKLYALDVKVKRLDNNWPITAKQPTKPAIHVNPNFLKNVGVAQAALPSEMEEILQVKTRELLELKKRKLELELEKTKKHLEEQQHQLNQTTNAVIASGSPGYTHCMNSRLMSPPATTDIMQPPQIATALSCGSINQIYKSNQASQIVPTPAALPMHSETLSQVSNTASNLHKPKVHPVNSALLNSVRQRDPRLARQQQQQKDESNLIKPFQRNHKELKSDSKSSPRHGSSSNTSKSNRSRSKSPSRHSSCTRSAGSGRVHKSNCSRNSSDKDHRKRSESKSSTTSSSSSSSSVSDRRKGTSSTITTASAAPVTSSILEKSNTDTTSTVSKFDYDTFDIESLSSSSKKRKSSSPPASPIKNKRSTKSSHRGKSSNSRSRSPNEYKDVDMRTISTSSRIRSTPEKRSTMEVTNQLDTAEIKSTNAIAITTNVIAAIDLEKPIFLNILEPPAPIIISSSMDIDLRKLGPPPLVPVALPSVGHPALVNSASSSTNTTTSQTTRTSSELTTETSSPNNTNTSTITTDNTTRTSTNTLPTKVSFKIQKPFNKLEKSTANSTFTTTTTSALSSSSSAAVSLVGNVSDKPLNSVAVTSGEKRTSTATSSTSSLGATSLDSEEPLQKKPKSSKIDALFGSEDVDLRKEILTSQTSGHKKVQSGIPTPPPPMISSEDEGNISSKSENWNNERNKFVFPTKNSTLDEIRAKLAKTAKQNKSSKSDKSIKDQAQRLKLSEINLNDDSQEANDEKIRIILTQAQEMFENNGMNQEQYKDLVQKMMSINEASKLKEAKRREAYTDDVSIVDLPVEERERIAARDAVLRKRIPKITKANEKQLTNDSPRSDGGSGGSPMYDEGRLDNNANATTSGTKSHTKSGKEKRRKPSKWGDQVDQNAAWATSSGPSSSLGGNNKRGGSYRGGAQQIPNAPSNMRMSVPMPWGGLPQPFAGGVIGMHMMQPIRSSVPPPPQPPAQMIALPQNIPKPSNSIDNPQADLMRSITIDGTSKEIRIYNQVAIVFMEGDVPHEIGFKPGQRALIIDNMEPFTLQFNDSYKPITIDGNVHHIRFGFPSHELYIDDQWYEIYFGGPPTTIPIRNKLHVLKSEGPPPQVHIGNVRRDLVAGKIRMIVDAHKIVPLFLDGKVQTFRLGDHQHTVQFIDNFLNVLFDGELHSVEYGGLPKSISLMGRKYFIRFGTLPQGVVAGKIQVQDMLYVKTEAPNVKPIAVEISNNAPQTFVDETKTETKSEESEPAADISASAPDPAISLANVNIDELFQKLLSSGVIGTAISNASTNVAVLKDLNKAENSTSVAIVEPNEKYETAVETSLRTVQQTTKQQTTTQPTTEPIQFIDLSKSESVKTRQSAIITALFSGMQCSSCGVRFPPEQTIKYSQHLDWHFRQNRRERDSSRKALSRKWHYDLTDWIQYEEIEDLEEREKNFMEAQQNGPDAIDETSNQRSVGSPAPSCAAGPDDVDRSCDMCHEKFEQFYNEELEEWHMRAAVRVEDKIYHPLCYEDYKVSLNPSAPDVQTSKHSKNEEVLLNTTDDNAVDIVIKIESEDKDDYRSNSTEDDDDDVIVLPNDEPSVTEIMDDDDVYVPLSDTTVDEGKTEEIQHPQEPQTADLKKKSLEKPDNTATLNETVESDVEIQEPNIPFTDLDNYIEKELPPLDEAAKAALFNVKIKEEPNDDYFDEDDGFEDVGTVLIVPGEEISIQSSEDTQTHTIGSSDSPATERPPSVTSITAQSDALELEPVIEAEFSASTTSVVDLNASMDGNLESQETHNLSAAGPAPALPLASLVNKIKINITKNINSSHSSSASNNNNASHAVTVITTTASETKHSSPISVLNSDAVSNSNNILGEVSNIQTISTIPVLCGGNTFVPKITTSCSAPANISTISVIGSSYGSSNINNNTRFNPMPKPSIIPVSATSASTSTPTAIAKTPSSTGPRQTTPPPVETEPHIVLKPALRNITLKKTEKMVNGVETSGLCSIM